MIRSPCVRPIPVTLCRDLRLWILPGLRVFFIFLFFVWASTVVKPYPRVAAFALPSIDVQITLSSGSPLCLSHDSPSLCAALTRTFMSFRVASSHQFSCIILRFRNDVSFFSLPLRSPQ